MPPIRKVVRIVRILGFIALLSTLLFQNANRALAAETVDEVLLSGNDVWSIENKTLTVNKGIVVTENATLQVINSKITLSTSANITLKDPKDGNPRLVVSNSTIEGYSATTKSRIYTYGNSTVSANQTNIRKPEFLSSDSSNVTIAYSNVSASFLSSGSATVSILSGAMNKITAFYPRIQAAENSSILLNRFAINLGMTIIGNDTGTISLLDSQGRDCEIQMYKNSKLLVSGGARYFGMKFYDNSKGELEGVGIIDNVYAYNLSDVKLSNTATFGRLRAQDHASLSINNTDVLLNPIIEGASVPVDPTDLKLRSGLGATGNAQVTTMQSTIDIARIFDDAKATFISTVLRDARFYNHTNVICLGVAEDIRGDFNDYSYGVVNVQSRGDISFNLKSFSKMIIRDSSVVGRLYLDDHAEAQIVNSVLRLFYVRDYAEVSLVKTKVTGAVGVSDNGIVEMSGSYIVLIEMTDVSRLSASSKSVIQTLICRSLSQARILGSEIGEITTELSLVEASFSDITPRTFATWDLYANASLQILDGGECPSISLVGTKITRGWSFFIKDSTVEFTSCKLSTFEAFDNSTVKFYNTTTQYQVLRGAAQVEVYWYLDVIAQNGTIVSVTDQNSETRTINVTNNQARFTLFEKSTGVSGTTTANNYTVAFDYNGQRQQQTIAATSNVAFDLTQPSWLTANWYVVVILVVIVALLAALVYRRTKRAKRVETET